ncbi:MAG: LysM domain-containing protein [Candidatus Promineifilaceae bacterium]|nr:LysM domain-containing protein [Candidatus Promineifilaceae bacterium]
MVSRHNIRRQLPRLLALFLILGLVLVACERPLQNNNAPAAEEVTEEDLEQGGGTPAETEEGEAVGEEEQAEEATEAEPTEETEAPEETEMAEEEAEAAEEAEEAEEAETEEEEASPRPEEEAEAEEAAEAEETEEAEAEETEAEEAETEGAEETVTEGAAEEETGEPRTHVVQPGENLYRIGLQYGISWVVLAEANNITNPNRIVVGQELTIPSESDDDDEPSPTPTPGEETTYVVQPGDNLYRIGRMFNMSWVEIAEANGIVNPNHILVGQVLTIPGEAPPSEVTHTVQPGETLFRISLEYGVPWTTIATANDINPPYVIYPGQVLTIPGG